MTRVWHGLLGGIIVVALVGQTIDVVQTDSSLVDLFSYFTIQANLLVLVAAVLIAIQPHRSGPAWRVLRLAGLVGITVTGVVYTVAIGPHVSFEGLPWWYDKAFHYVVPLMTAIGHVALRPRTVFQRSDLVFIAWPVAWLAYTLTRAELGAPQFKAPNGQVSRYPYDFLDVEAHGGVFVAVACVLVTVLLLSVAAGYLRFSTDKSSARTH